MALKERNHPARGWSFHIAGLIEQFNLYAVSPSPSMLSAALRRRYSAPFLLTVALLSSAAGYVLGLTSLNRAKASYEASSRSQPTPHLQESRSSGNALPNHETEATLSRTASFQTKWNAWLSTPRCPATERAALAALETYASENPGDAMRTALAEQNLHLKERMREAVLRGWAQSNPSEAARWTQSLPKEDRRSAVAAVFAGAASRAEQIPALARELCAANPVSASDYDHLAIAALSDVGAYELAAQYALGDQIENRPALLNSAFHQWAAQEPAKAVDSLRLIADPSDRLAAQQGVWSGWADSNPAELTRYAMRLEDATQRSQALNFSLPEWASRDAAGASEWMLNQLEPNPNTDQAVAAVASMPRFLTKKPEVAVGWAEKISDPQLRETILRFIAAEAAR
jgi:hypothetical protein